jgi:hypothetical protein
MISSIPCSVNPATSNTISVSVFPLPTLSTILSDQTYCQGVQTFPILLAGSPTGVVFDIAGGAAIGLTNQTGVTEIPFFTPNASGNATITVTPRANNCIGEPVTYNILVNPTNSYFSQIRYVKGSDITNYINLKLLQSCLSLQEELVGLIDQIGAYSIPITPVTGNAQLTGTPELTTVLALS